MARVDIEIEEYLDEVRTVYLVRELIQRKDFEDELKKELQRTQTSTKISVENITLPEFKNPEQLLFYIKRLLNLRQWADKKRIISEIENL
jgi:hypothetical protein